MESEEFTRILEQATAEKISVENRAESAVKDLECQFIDEMVKSNPKISGIVSKKNPSQDEKDILKDWMREQRKLFKAVSGIVTKASTGTNPLDALVAKIAEVAAILEYLGNTTLRDKFAERGINFEVTPFEQGNEHLSKPETRTVVADIFVQTVEAKKELKDLEDRLDSDFYGNLSEEVKYDKDSNASGIKLADFKKLVKVKQESMTETSAKYTAFKDKVIADAQASLDKAQALLGKIEGM